ncbi:MAG: ABC transporter permease [Chthoniobacter sp.]|uniref:ABC transporter permease n=1 Tax=Chthoniobacter sp. TaxID=2510640 RepID=UPI0032ADD21E
MKLTATFRIALRALMRNKMRSILTMLGIIIGVLAVIAMIGIGNGAKSQVEAQVATLGKNMVLVFSGSSTSSGVKGGYGAAGTMKVEDSVAILREVPGVTMVSPEVRTYTQVAAGNQNWYTQVLGESADYFEMRQWVFTGGSSFSEQDIRSANKVGVIGKTTAQQIFGDEDPVGQIIRVRNVPFKITGVLKSKGFSLGGMDQDDVFVVPYTTAMKRLTGATVLRGINVQAADDDVMARVSEGISSLLRQRHNIRTGHDDDFTVRSQQDLAEMFTAQSKTMMYLLVAIAIVSLLVGGIGIMNIMLVSVTERTREIGIRMAVGAHGRDIMLQFLIEAVTLSSIGGFIGIVLGFGAAETISYFAHWPTMVPPIYVIVSFLFSAAVGVFFGLYPAKKAAALDPIDALRYE